MGVTFVVAVLIAAPPEPAADLHAPFHRLLVAHVKDGAVEYRAFKDREGELDAYRAALAGVDPAALSQNGRLALWINAYNAFTLKLILERCPGIKSIKEISGRWTQVRWVVGGKKRSLGQIEHEIRRKEFQEPRIHFAIACASKSCPILLSEAHEAQTINEQLARAARGFLADPRNGSRAESEPRLLYGTNHGVYLSSIFKRFEAVTGA